MSQIIDNIQHNTKPFSERVLKANFQQSLPLISLLRHDTKCRIKAGIEDNGTKNGDSSGKR